MTQTQVQVCIPMKSKLSWIFPILFPFLGFSQSIQGDNSVCIGSSTVLTCVSCGTPPSSPVSPWSSSNPSVATIDINGEVNGLSAGNVTIIYTDYLGGTVSTSFSVLNKALKPTYTAAGGLPVQYCVGEQTTPLTASNSTPGTLLWFNDDGTPTNTIFGSSGAPTPTTSIADTGTINYKVVLDPYNTNLCTSDTLIIPVVVHNNPTITTSGNTTICQGESATLNASGAGIGGTYYWNGGLVHNTTVTFTPVINTEYIVVGTDQYGCQGTDTTLITVNPSPAAPTTNLSNVIQYCLGATSSAMSAVASSGNTLKWYDINDNLLATGATGPVPSTASAGSVTYKVTQTNGTSQCESSALLITVTVVNLPTISVVGGASQSVCDGSSVTLTGSGAGTGGSYSWTGGISNGVSFTPTSSSSYTVTGTDGNGCSNTATATVTVNPLPAAPTVDPSNVTQYCLGATSSAMSAVASSGNTLKWYDINDNLLATGATGPVPSTASAGSVTYKVTQTNGTSQCESSALLITVTVVNLPTISVVGGASQSVCDGSSVTLNGSGGVSYSWTGVDASGNAISNNASFVPPASTTTTYTVTGTDGNGCSNTASVDVTSTAAPSISAGADVTICAGESVTLTGSGAGTGGSYSWTGGVSNGVSFTPTATTTYTVTGTDANGCSATDQVTVTVNPLPAAPTVDPSNVTQYCLGATSSAMSAVASSGNTLKWYDINDNLLATGATGPVPSTASAGSVTYKVTQTNGTSQCESSALLITVTVVNLPTISVVGGASQSVCDGSSVTLNGSGGVSYSWTGVDASGNAISNNASFVPPASTTTTYTVTGTDGNGCSNTASVDVTSTAAPSISAGADVTICAGESVTLTGSGAGTGGSYSWTGGVSNGVSFTPTATTTYTVTGTDANGCSATDQVTVTVNPLPAAPTVDPSNVTQYCLGATSSAMSAVASSGNTLKWYDINDNLLATGATGPVPSTASAGSVTYKVTQTDANGCESLPLNISVTTNALPTISVVGGASQSVCNGESLTLSGSGAGSGGSYSWTGGISNGVSFTPTSSSSYTVTGTDGNGCSNTATATVTVNPLPAAPTVDPSNVTQYCLGATSSAMSAVASSGNTLKWYDINDNLLATGATGPVPSTASAGSVTYKVTQTNGTSQCESSALLITVTVVNLPTISVVGGASQSVCDGSSVTLNGSGGPVVVIVGRVVLVMESRLRQLRHQVIR